MICPECFGQDVYKPVGSPEEKTDGQGFAWTIIHNYECNECGCIWNVIEETVKKIKIVKHGKLKLDWSVID